MSCCIADCKILTELGHAVLQYGTETGFYIGYFLAKGEMRGFTLVYKATATIDEPEASILASN